LIVFVATKHVDVVVVGEGGRKEMRSLTDELFPTGLHIGWWSRFLNFIWFTLLRWRSRFLYFLWLGLRWWFRFLLINKSTFLRL
jgi:hypothetical protein